MLDTESKRILRLKEIIYPSRTQFIKGLIKDDVWFEIPELESYKRAVVCLMDKSRAALDCMHYTRILLEHSKWHDSYECVKPDDSFRVQMGDIVVPVWGSELNEEMLKQKVGGQMSVFPSITTYLLEA